MLAIPKETGEQTSLADDNVTRTENFVKEVALDFPSPLTNVASTLAGINQSKRQIRKQPLFSFRLHLWIAFIMWLFSFIVSVMNLSTCCNSTPLPTFLLLYVRCGILVIMVYFSAIIFCYLSNDHTNLIHHGHTLIRHIFVFTHLVILFCIVWLFIGHIWIYGDWPYYETYALTGFGIAIVFIQYVIWIWLIMSYAWNRAWILRLLTKMIENRLNEFSCELGNCETVYAIKNQSSNKNNTSQNKIVLNV
ncbi:unnamed protein product [Rotaria magnacalcarata]|uniref:Uncharacterized protein n=1 Tax=Rotaria magnacalcarata TaxID=392030 RepID=A0A817AC53_9BILA|nr:unnamed protein product [Rotaria magnacalcarata]